MAIQGRKKRTLGRALLLAVGALVLFWTQMSGQEPISPTLIPPGDTKPIQLYAENISTWTDGKLRLFLLQGKVWVEQGQVNLRMPQAVIWLDEDRKKQTGTYFLDIYGEGGVELANGAASKKGPDALFHMSTRGEIRIKAYANKVAQKDMSAEAVFQRAVKMKSRPPAPAQPKTAELESPGTIQPAQFVQPPPNAALGVQPAPAPAQFPTGPSPALPTPQTPTQQIPVPQVQPALPPPGAPAPTPVANAPGSPGPKGPGGLFAPPANGEPRKFTVRPRGAQGITFQNYSINAETVFVIPNPVIVTVTNPSDNKVIADIEADRVAFWTPGKPNEVLGNLSSPQGETSRHLEFYLSGNVEVRNSSGKETETLRADEVYYDVSRNVAIALRGDLEVREPKIPYPIHFQAEELIQLNAQQWQGKMARVYSTQLPSDPGLRIEIREFTLNEEEIIKKGTFGTTIIDPKTGQPEIYKQRTFTGSDNVLRLEGVPFLYFPRLKGDIQDPLGPLDSLGTNYNRIFGFQFLTTWDLYELLGIYKTPGTRWRLMADVLTLRGPALGTEYDFAGKDMFGIPSKYDGMIKAYGIYDTGPDILGGGRGQLIYTSPFTTEPVTHPPWRGRFLAQDNIQEMPLGFSVQAKVSAISDQNYLEQFFAREWQNDLNQETYLYVKQQNGIWAWTALAEPNIRRWITETEWLPKADGTILGLSLLDTFTYNMKASAGYGRLMPTEQPQFSYFPTDKLDSTGRFDLWQELSLPFNMGPFKLVPYVVADGAYYTQDLGNAPTSPNMSVPPTNVNGDGRGRLYGAAGIRASIPFSKLYADVQSELFNLDGIYHKITLTGNYYNAASSAHINQLPQLDRFNDDASDQALRDLFFRQPTLNPANAIFLTQSALVNPQFYALRRLIDDRVDTLDNIDVLQLALLQRWQTKRGMPGNEHVIDWMTLNLGISIYPQSARDNFGQTFGVIEYDWLWNVGDRTALVSNGWFETETGGPRVFNLGVVLNRPDKTNFYLGYRQIDPLNSRAFVGSLTYAFSAKYAITASTFYDFGVNTQSNSLVISRIGTDLQINFGLTYNSILNNFGVTFEILPNLLPANRMGSHAIGSGTIAQR
ncbi:MAG: hypothetical protein HY040_00030 [Planctomycetes bacterium]|nr:hypothetical protein [Planctomycetota bacterium]